MKVRFVCYFDFVYEIVIKIGMILKCLIKFFFCFCFHWNSKIIVFVENFLELRFSFFCLILLFMSTLLFINFIVILQSVRFVFNIIIETFSQTFRLSFNNAYFYFSWIQSLPKFLNCCEFPKSWKSWKDNCMSK